MATTTPNFGWAVPTSTDLVKDGATAIETLGDSIDASLVDLKGGTTGQVLSKNSNTDMDFVWVTDAGDISGVTAGTGISGGGTSGTVTITNSMATAIDAKGDLVAGTGADAFSRIGVGTNGQVLTADSSTATGLNWATSSAALDLEEIATGTIPSGATLSVTGLGGYDTLEVRISGISVGSNSRVRFYFNADQTSGNWEYNGFDLLARSTYSQGDRDWFYATGENFYDVIGTNYQEGSNQSNQYRFRITNAKAAGKTMVQNASVFKVNAGGVSNYAMATSLGFWKTSAQITSIHFNSRDANFSTGSYTIWGA